MPVHTVQSATAAAQNTAVHLSDLALYIGAATNADGTDRALVAADLIPSLLDTSGVPTGTRDVTNFTLERGGSIAQPAQQPTWAAFDVTYFGPATDAKYIQLRDALVNSTLMKYDRLFTDLTGVYGFCLVTGWAPVPGNLMQYTFTVAPTGNQTPYNAAGTSV